MIYCRERAFKLFQITVAVVLLSILPSPAPAAILADGFHPGTDKVVNALALQPDGKLLVGGEFGTLGGQARSYLGRLNADGSRDTTWNPGAMGKVYTLALQPDGKILIGGKFSTLGHMPRAYLGRLTQIGGP